MLPQDQLEYAVYRAAAVGDRSQGRSVSWGELSSEVGQPNDTVLLNLLKYLCKEDLLELKKWVATVWEIYPDTTLTDEQYFFTGDFRLVITAPGQRRYEELEQQHKSLMHIADALDREQIRFVQLAEEISRDVQSEVGRIPVPTVPSGQYAARIIDIHIRALERLIRSRIEERGKNVLLVPELLNADQVANLRNELSASIDNRLRAAAEWLRVRGYEAPVTLGADEWEDQKLRLRGLISNLLRDMELSHRLDPPKAPGLAAAPHLDEVVFVSCGQYTDDEKNLGMALAGAISELTPYQGYFAENQNSLQGLSQHIFGALNRAVGLVAVMHHRGEVSTRSGSHIRASVWIEQEIAIAAFLTAQGRDFPVQLYIQKGIKREGAREQLRLKPIEFETDAEVIADFRSRLETGAFALARHAAEIDLRAMVGYRVLHKSGQIHRYELIVTVENAGTAPVNNYWAELRFPKSLMDMSGIIVGEEKSRETQTHRFFRVTGKDLGRTLFPGDRVNVLPIEYRMDSALFDNPAVRDETVEIAVSAVGMKRVRIQKKISELNEF